MGGVWVGVSAGYEWEAFYVCVFRLLELEDLIKLNIGQVNMKLTPPFVAANDVTADWRVLCRPVRWQS